MFTEKGIFIKQLVGPTDGCGAVQQCAPGPEGHLITTECSTNNIHCLKIYRYKPCECHRYRPGSSKRPETPNRYQVRKGGEESKTSQPSISYEKQSWGDSDKPVKCTCCHTWIINQEPFNSFFYLCGFSWTIMILIILIRIDWLKRIEKINGWLHWIQWWVVSCVAPTHIVYTQHISCLQPTCLSSTGITSQCRNHKCMTRTFCIGN